MRSLLSITGIAGAIAVVLAPTSFEEAGVCGPAAELAVALFVAERSRASSSVREMALAALMQTL